MIKKQYIGQLKKSIETLSKWESSGKAFGYFEKIKNKKADRLYEFFCYMKIMDDLKNRYNIELVEDTNGKIFPQSPAAKSGWSKFILKDKESGKVLFQVCFGTKIKLSTSPMTPFAADISFQKSTASDDPDENDVELIMDAKYKTDNLQSLEISTIREFAKCADDLGVSEAETALFEFDKLKALKGNCLLTNGRAINDHEQYCKNNKVKQVGSFDCNGGSFNVIG